MTVIPFSAVMQELYTINGWPTYYDFPIICRHTHSLRRGAALRIPQANYSWKIHMNWATLCSGRGAGDVIALLGYWAALVVSLLLTSWDNISEKFSAEAPGRYDWYVVCFNLLTLPGLTAQWKIGHRKVGWRALNLGIISNFLKSIILLVFNQELCDENVCFNGGRAPLVHHFGNTLKSALCSHKYAVGKQLK